MAKAQYITKVTTKKVDGKPVKEEVTYRVDADFVPSNINEVCLEFMMNYCKAHNEGDWMITTSSNTITDKKGKKRDYPFVSLRADFMKKFFPNVLKGEKKENKPMKNRIADFFK